MPPLHTVVDYLDQLLKIDTIPGDKSNNGLQVEAGAEVRTIIGGVDASLELYHRAAEHNADLVVVHHGESWGAGIQYLTGRTGARFGYLLKRGISLYAAHLPMDAHAELGHNACIARMLNLQDPEPFAEYAGAMIGVCGALPVPLPLTELKQHLDGALETDAALFSFHSGDVRRVGIVSGGGGAAIDACRQHDLQCLITGEFGHAWYHPARESGVSVLAGGHYRTESPGVKAVLDALAERFGVACQFIDLPTGL